MSDTIGERIVELLHKKGITQSELSGLAQITEASLSRYIKGTREPKATVVANIALGLHTSSDYLLGIEKDRKGHWIPWMHNNDKYAYGKITIYKCSECNTSAGHLTNFCPTCGADMRDEKSD